MTLKALLAAALIGVSAIMSPAVSATVTEQAVAAYHNGRVLDAAQMLETAAAQTPNVNERWSVLSMLIDTCSYSYQHACIAKNMKAYLDAANELKQPSVTTGPVIFNIAFERHLAGDAKFIREKFGRDFSLKYANPLQDPILATRFYLLNAAVEQHDGNFDEARKYINRAFASLLRINTDNGAFITASLLKATISSLFANHDLERGNKWLQVSTGFLSNNLPRSSFESSELTLLLSFSMTLRSNFSLASDGYALAEKSISGLQIAPFQKEVLLSEAVIAHAATVAAQGDLAEARRIFSHDPIRARRAGTIKAGKFSTYSELYSAAAEIFFDALAGVSPDHSWAPLLENIPDWQFSQNAQADAYTYRDVAKALLVSQADKERARKIFNDAIADRLRLFEKQRSDTIAFPLPNLLDRLIMQLGAVYWAKSGDSQSADLLLGSMELLNRNIRYTVSDTLATLVAQETEDQRRAAHAQRRLIANQEIWEVERLTELANRVAGKKPFPARNWEPQNVAKDYDRALQRIQNHIKPPGIKLPTRQELQTALEESEAFVGYVSGVRVCITRHGIWGEQAVDPARGQRVDQVRFDLKVLRNALTDQNAPSDVSDAQYPVEAAIRTHNVLLGGFDQCLKDVKHIVFFSPSDEVAIPLGALLRDLPPKLGTGYDLSKAHWLILDYAFSQVTSIRDFLSSRTLSRKPSGDQFFAGVGNPILNTRLADGQTGGREIVLRSGKVGSESLRELHELPETIAELRSISSTVGQATLLLGESATEERFRALPLGQFEVIHFATHGLVRGDVEGLAEAALVLTPKAMDDGQNDGLLTTSDIANLNLAARLVVLSACNTANFDAAAFNAQLQGFATAFAVAGTPATIGSLWSVESATSMRLMQNLYKHLVSSSGMQIAVALQRATIDTIRSAPSKPFTHPRFWAPFILTGDGAAIVQRPKPTSAPLAEAVSVQEGGGEVMGAVEDDGQLVTSEIGPATDGRHSSRVVARDLSDKQVWSIENHEIGAGKIVPVAKGYVVSGYKSAGRVVLRKISRTGKVEWAVEPKSAYADAMVQTITGGVDGFWIVLGPLSPSMENNSAELIRFDPLGKELARRSLVGLPKSLSFGIRPFVSADVDGKSYLAINSEAATINTYRDSFGYISVCTKGAAVSIYELDQHSLSTVRTADLRDLQISQLVGLRGRLHYAGAIMNSCANEGSRAVMGLFTDKLEATKIWEDSSIFSGTLIAITDTPKGFMAAAQISEPVRFSQKQVDESGQIPLDQRTPVFGKKHLEAEDDSLSEVSMVDIDNGGKTISRRYLGNGLSQYAAGMLPTKGGIFVYGSAGFNPWLEKVR